jgi:hypothetical protein
MDEQSESKMQRTEHAMLVAWGDFAHGLQLAERLRQQVAIPRHHENIPGADLILEYGLLFLSGSTELQDLNLGPRPLVKDTAVQEAWDVQFGHYTSVSRALRSATAETVGQVISVLDEISQPFIVREVEALAASGQALLLFADLSGHEVSAYSQSYPHARWGHMGNALALGHQHALITLRGQAYRVHLAGFLHPGDTVAELCLRELIQAAERRLGCRPRRRVELVRGRLEALQSQRREYRVRMSQQGDAWQVETARQGDLAARLTAQEQRLVELEAKQGDQPLRPHAQLAKARRQQGSWQRQLERSQCREERIRAQIAHYQEKIDHLSAEEASLQQWYALLLADNASNPNPVPIQILLDGGFSGGPNLTYLIEMGYEVLAVGKGTSARALRQERPAGAVGDPVTAQVQLWESAPAVVGTCPYPLRRILQHWHAGEKERYSIWLQYPAHAALPLPQVFTAYHQRQHVEAGVKQGKSVFGGRRVRVRSAAGLELLNQFAFVFWPNFVHWATDWLLPRVRQSSNVFEAVLQTVKTQVRVAAQTPATVFTAPGSRVLAFSPDGPYPDVCLELDGVDAFQLALPLFRCQQPGDLAPLSPRRLLSPPDG